MPEHGRDARGPASVPLHMAPLDTHVVGSRIILYEEVDSTNECALRIGGHGTVLVADRQTAGRGRHGRSWSSLAGLGLWLSIAFEKPLPGIIFAAPLAVRDALRGYAQPEAKWPNDICLAGKKVCGILLEHRGEQTALGIGINVHHREKDFPEDLRGGATSVEMASGRPCDRGKLLHDVLTRLDDRVMVLEAGAIELVRREWVEACGIMGKRVRSGGVEGTVTAVDNHGALTLETGHGPRRLVFGEMAEVEGES